MHIIIQLNLPIDGDGAILALNYDKYGLICGVGGEVEKEFIIVK